MPDSSTGDNHAAATVASPLCSLFSTSGSSAAVMKRTFRNTAIVAGLIERTHQGRRKTGRQATFSSDILYDTLRRYDPDHLLLQITREEALRGLIDFSRIEQLLARVGDNIVLKLKTDGDVITDGGFVGDGCAISQASADIMLGMIVGQKKEKALEMGRTFLRMIHGEATEEEIESLEEASALKDIAHMPARVKCAMLGWRTLSEALTGKVEE